MAEVRASRYGDPAPRPASQKVKKRSFLKRAFSKRSIGASMLGGAKGFLTGGYVGMAVGATQAGLKATREQGAEDDALSAEQEQLDYDQLVAQRALNRQRAVSDGLSEWYGAQASNPAFLKASKLGDPIVMPKFDPGLVYGTDTTDWQVPVAPSTKAPAWYDGLSQTAEAGLGAYGDALARDREAKRLQPTGYRNNPKFNPGTFDYKRPPSYMPLAQRTISLGGSSYVPPTQRSYFG